MDPISQQIAQARCTYLQTRRQQHIDKIAAQEAAQITQGTSS